MKSLFRDRDKKLLYVFSIGLIFKIVLILLTKPPVVANLFAPFISYFVQSGFDNPYQEFHRREIFDAFPYSSIMLWLYSLPVALISVVSKNFVDSSPQMLFVLPRLVVLFADFVIFKSLMTLLPAHKSRLLYFWWLNPIVAYICYVHGQLDALPTAALLISVVLLFSGKEIWSFVALGFGIAMKSHLLAALPFMALYVYFKHFSVRRAVGVSLITLGLFVLLQLPYWSEGYVQLVLLEKRSLRLFSLSFPFDDQGKAFLFAPAVVLFLIFRFASLQTTHRDTLMLTLGMLYAAMVSVVPPTPGWFLWSVPFLVYFFIKYRETSQLSFYSLMVLYVLYQLFDRNSDVPAVFSHLFVDGSQQSLFAWIDAQGFDALRVENLLFTALEGALVMNVLWVYKVGISSSNLMRRLKQNFRIGICGDSGSGKSTLTDALVSLFGVQDVLVVAGDDLHKWERGHEKWQQQTHLDPKSNRLHEDVDQAAKLMVGQNVKRAFYDHKTGRFTEKRAIESKPYIIFQGLHTFFLERMRNMIHVKVFIDPDRTLRFFWKVKRDMAYRGYTKEQVLAQIEKREPDAIKYIESQKIHADMIIRYLPENSELSLDEMLAKDDVAIKLQVVLNADLNVEDLVVALNETGKLQSEYWYEPENGRIVFECKKTELAHLSNEEVGEIASKISTTHQELVGTAPKWQNGFEGVLQLVMLLYLANFYAERRRA